MAGFGYPYGGYGGWGDTADWIGGYGGLGFGFGYPFWGLGGLGRWLGLGRHGLGRLGLGWHGWGGWAGVVTAGGAITTPTIRVAVTSRREERRPRRGDEWHRGGRGAMEI